MSIEDRLRNQKQKLRISLNKSEEANAALLTKTGKQNISILSLVSENSELKAKISELNNDLVLLDRELSDKQNMLEHISAFNDELQNDMVQFVEGKEAIETLNSIKKMLL